jgi:hypothetical protein
MPQAAAGELAALARVPRLVAGGRRVAAVVTAVQGNLDGLYRPLQVVRAVRMKACRMAVRHWVLLVRA